MSKNKHARFSISVDDFHKIMLYSLNYEKKRVPGLPRMSMILKLLGEPACSVNRYLDVWESGLGWPKNCEHLLK